MEMFLLIFGASCAATLFWEYRRDDRPFWFCACIFVLGVLTLGFGWINWIMEKVMVVPGPHSVFNWLVLPVLPLPLGVGLGKIITRILDARESNWREVW